MKQQLRPGIERAGPQMTRRSVLTGTLGLLAACTSNASASQDEFASRIETIRRSYGGRFGVSIRDTQSGRHLGFAADDRFAMCSTFKLLLAGHVLTLVDNGRLALDQTLPYEAAQLLPNSPVTARHVGQRALNLRELCAAILEVSDNTAANLLLRHTGGPAGLTAFLRTLGDNVTRLDREETELNTNLPGDLRDTTTPAAMTATMQQLLVGNALAATSRAQLIAWMSKSQTGLRRLRAGLPRTWSAGDKTGTGSNGAVNDVMIAWPPGRQPVMAAVYLSGASTARHELEDAHAQIGALIVELIG